MDPFVDLAGRLYDLSRGWGSLPRLLAGPLDDVGNLIFYREVHSFVRDALEDYGASLFARSMAWVGAVTITLLTLWITVQGYRITTGRSRDSMIVMVTDAVKATLIVGVATGMAVGGGTLFEFITHDLAHEINRLVTGQTGDLYERIDRTLGYLQLALGSIDAIHTGGSQLLQDAKDRNMDFVGIGMGVPAIVAGGMLLAYKGMTALIVGFAPLCVLCLLFKQSSQVFMNWLLYLLSTLFGLAVLVVMASLSMDMICAAAVAFWTGKLLGSNPEGITSLAMQQGGMGLILTALIISLPLAASRLFKGLLAEFMPFSAFGGHGGARLAAPSAQAGPSHTYVPERDHAPTPTHAHRVSAPAQAQADEVKQVADTRSFSERYPNALASLDGHGGSGDSLPEEIRSQAGLNTTGGHRSQPWSMGLDDGLDEMAALSPTLQADILRLKQMDWEFRYGPIDAGSQARRGFKDLTISIDGKWKENTREGFRAVVHEIGHGVYPYREDHSSKGAYIVAALADEAAAMMKNIQIQREILVNTQGKIDIGINGAATNHAAYNAAYDQFLLDGDADKARKTIGEVFGEKETTSSKATGKIVPYRDYYGEFYDLKHRR